jgi:hypothetical protein
LQDERPGNNRENQKNAQNDPGYQACLRQERFKLTLKNNDGK